MKLTITDRELGRLLSVCAQHPHHASVVMVPREWNNGYEVTAGMIMQEAALRLGGRRHDASALWLGLVNLLVGFGLGWAALALT